MIARLRKQIGRAARAGAVLTLAFVTGYVMQDGPAVQARLIAVANGFVTGSSLTEAGAVAVHTSGTRIPAPATGTERSERDPSKTWQATTTGSLPSVAQASMAGPDASVALSGGSATTSEKGGGALEHAGPSELHCGIELSARPGPEATIQGQVSAPCHALELATVSYSGVRFSLQLDESGSAELDLPALATDSVVRVKLTNGHFEEARVAVPQAGDLTRVAMTWRGWKSVSLHVFEANAPYGSTGHVRAGHPHLTVLGEADSVTGWQTTIYTMPGEVDHFGSQQISPKVSFTLEARVRAETCGRRLSAEAVTKLAGRSRAGAPTPIAISFPGCGAIGSVTIVPDVVPALNWQTVHAAATQL